MSLRPTVDFFATFWFCIVAAAVHSTDVERLAKLGLLLLLQERGGHLFLVTDSTAALFRGFTCAPHSGTALNVLFRHAMVGFMLRPAEGWLPEQPSQLGVLCELHVVLPIRDRVSYF